MILPVLLAQPSSGADANVTLDDEKIKDEIPAGLQKVELDLDDALFLEFEDEEETPAEEPAEEQPAKEQPETAAPPKKKFSKKLLIILLAALLLLLLGGAGAYYFLQSSPETTTTNATAPPTPKEQVHEPPHETGHAEPPKPKEIVPRQPVLKPYFLDPFQVEFIQGDNSRFLTCRIIIPEVSEITYLEIGTRIIPVRDAIYTYLKKTPVSLLDDPDYAEKLKKELTSALNRVIKSSELKTVLIEDYVVK